MIILVLGFVFWSVMLLIGILAVIFPTVKRRPQHRQAPPAPPWDNSKIIRHYPRKEHARS